MARPVKKLEDINIDGWQLLESLAMWTTAEYCATQLGISVDTLDRRLKEKFNYGYAEYKHKRQELIRINLLKKQYDTAMQGNVSMLIWLGKNLLSQSDKQDTTINKDGKSIHITVSKDGD